MVCVLRQLQLRQTQRRQWNNYRYKRWRELADSSPWCARMCGYPGTMHRHRGCGTSGYTASAFPVTFSDARCSIHSVACGVFIFSLAGAAASVSIGCEPLCWSNGVRSISTMPRAPIKPTSTGVVGSRSVCTKVGPGLSVANNSHLRLPWHSLRRIR